MDQNRAVEAHTDRSFEIISFAVLAILSALSHFWLILILFTAGLLIRESVSLLFRYLMDSLRLVPWHSWKVRAMSMCPTQLRHQVFKPSKIS